MRSDLGQRQLPQGDELSFRRPMAVTEALRFRTGGTYPVCPRCGVTMEMDYHPIWDRCGQLLEWTGFRRAAVVTRR